MDTCYYKLTYFNNKGRAEPTRLLFARAKQLFVDERLDDAGFAAIKHNGAPQGQLPFLTFNDKVIPQSRAIERFVARKFDLYGKNDEEKTDIDIVVETTEEAFIDIGKLWGLTDDKKERAVAEYSKNAFVRQCSRLETLLGENKKSGWFVGDKLTLADVVVFGLMEFVMALAYPGKSVESVYSKSDALINHMNKVRNADGIREYLASRPDTEF